MEHFESDYGETALPQSRRRVYPAARSQRRRGLWAATGAIAFLAAWAGGATLYILFNDEALKYLVERQVSITRSYETQAAALQTEIDRLRSLKLIEQERVDRAVADLARRQNVIETRHSAITALAAENPKGVPDTNDVTGGARSEPPALPSKPVNRPTPLSDTILIAPPGERFAQLHSRPLPPLGTDVNARDATTAVEVRVANLARELRRLEVAQSERLNGIEAEYDGRQRRMRKVLDDLGVHPNPAVRAAAAGSARAAMGGPFLPWSRAPEDPFVRQLHRIRTAAAAMQSLDREIGVIPVRRPILGESDVTSGFGMRIDPFLRQPAMHTGIDFRGDPGDPVKAAAAGKVVQAERNGGYGLMVEIDHGNGLATRYAHLSAIAVSNGATVAPGELIGRVGSTGRSTGPHLHYEIRLNGDATDPQRFLRAGLRLRDP